jgi:2-polyprenyl-3-methyl-5-hydroxy-6-metoxy-1,4-benzoquinol methylase
MGRHLSRRALEDEQMDAADLDPETYAAVLRHLGRVNRATFAARPTLGFLRDQEAAMRALGRPVRLLDVGFGGGEMLRTIWRSMKRQGIACELVGIDLNPRSAPVAEDMTDAGAPIRYLTGDYRSLAGQGWDFVISSLVVHHMNDAERGDFLAFMEREAQLGWFVNDLHRHAFAYHGFPLLARLLGVHRIVREDGQLSVARAFRPPEWEAIVRAAGLSDVARVERIFPFRLCVARNK